jgi:homopolymeric O-antigen transport system ATP-binding protein
MVSVKLENVNFSYHVPSVFQASARTLFLRAFGVVPKGAFSSTASNNISAITDFSLNLVDGDRLAVLGPNGAGKTTLLRLISGIFQPDSGRIEVSHSVFPLLSVGFGMDPEGTGLENIYLMGYLKGRSREESNSLVDVIQEISGLGDALYRPVYSYSSGMGARLAVAIAVCNKPRIIAVDEFIGTGDAEFRERSTALMREMFEQSGVLIFASHSIPLVKRMCNKAVWLEKGEIVAQGDVESVVEAGKQLRGSV